MPATVLGTAHLYGNEGTVTNATVLNFRDKLSAANQAQTEDETGNVIERRYDDNTNDASITLRMRTSYSIPNPGATLTYNSVTYEVVDAEKSTQNKGFREVTLNIKKSAGISYS